MCKQFFYLIILLCLLPSWASAFDNKETHRILTKEAIKQTAHFDDILKMQLGFEDVDAELSGCKDTHSITKWLQEGSYEEDKPACRAGNHFHNPLKS